MSGESKPADIPLNIFINYMIDKTDCDYATLDNGDKVIASPDKSVNVVLSTNREALHHSEIRDILGKLGYQPNEVTNMRVVLIRYEAGL